MTTYLSYRVIVRVQYPAWNEQDGVVFYVEAASKRDAIKQARRLNEQGGQIDGYQHGLSWWTATLSDTTTCGGR